MKEIPEKVKKRVGELQRWAGKRYLKALGLLHKPLACDRTNDPFDMAWKVFVDMANGIPKARVLEIGAGILPNTLCKRGLFKNCESYTGFDIHKGENVDVVGDAHFLSRYFASDSFHVVFSNSVFEHLLMPWKVALEINKVLKTGGIVAVTTHPAWPPHELPWDFWRFQPNSFMSLFNKYTGFELLESKGGVPGRLYGLTKDLLRPVQSIHRFPVELCVIAIAKKTHDYDGNALKWDADVTGITDTMYPFRHR